MNYTLSFPPVDAVVHQVREVDYHRLLREFLMLTVTVAAIIVGVSQFVYHSVVRWYQQRGQNLLLTVITHAHSSISSLLTLAYDKLAENCE